MSGARQAMTNVFVTLALVADAMAVWVFVAVAAAGLRMPGPLTRTARALGPLARPFAIAVALTATAGSLYYSEVVGYAPCQLCWYQRFAMYPLPVILAIGLWPRAARITRVIGMVVAAVGAGIAFYHWLVERVPALAETTSCSLTVPCSVPWFTRLGFVTIAWMAFSGFMAILAFLTCEWWGARDRGHASGTMQASESEDA